jgi:hypothetical protein
MLAILFCAIVRYQHHLTKKIGLSFNVAPKSKLNYHKCKSIDIYVLYLKRKYRCYLFMLFITVLCNVSFSFYFALFIAMQVIYSTCRAHIYFLGLF